MSKFAQAIFFVLRGILYLFCCFYFHQLIGQDFAVYEDDRRHLYVFEDNTIKKIEFIPVYKYYYGNDYVAYVNNRYEFKLYHKGKKYLILPMAPDTIIANDYLLGYIQASQLGIFDGKVSRTLQTWIEPSYFLGDSLFVFVDNFRILYAYQNGSKTVLEKWIPDQFQYWSSDNTLAYISNQDELIVLDHFGEKSVIENFKPKEVKVGRNIVAYNDYIGNFKIWNKGNLETIENYYVTGINTGNDFAVYTTNLNNWMGYYNGKKVELLSILPMSYSIKRNLLVFSDFAKNFYLFYKGKKMKLENFTPRKFLIDDDILVYQDLYGKLKGVIDGKQVEITDQIVLDFELCNKTVVYYEITPAQKKVWNNGKIYTFNIEDDTHRLIDQKY